LANLTSSFNIDKLILITNVVREGSNICPPKDKNNTGAENLVGVDFNALNEMAKAAMALMEDGSEENSTEEGKGAVGENTAEDN